MDGSWVISGGPMPTILGAVMGPAEGSFMEIGVELFEGRIMWQEGLNQADVTVPGGPMESGGAVLAEFSYRPAGIEHEKGGGGVVVPRSVNQEPAISWLELPDELRIFGQKGLG